MALPAMPEGMQLPALEEINVRLVIRESDSHGEIHSDDMLFALKVAVTRVAMDLRVRGTLESKSEGPISMRFEAAHEFKFKVKKT
jgi:hypothetical protein